MSDGKFLLSLLMGGSLFVGDTANGEAVNSISFSPLQEEVDRGGAGGEGWTLMRLDYRYGSRSDYAVVEESSSDTWVVFFHSFGGDALELYRSELLYPAWLNAIRAEKFGIVSFDTFGNSYMAPFVADAVHEVLKAVRARYEVKRFVFVGASMGGSAVLIYSVRYPEDVFAALAMCPVSDFEVHYEKGINTPGHHLYQWPVEDYYGKSPEERARNFSISSVQGNYRRLSMPLVIAHGTADTHIEVSQSDGLAELLKEKADFRYIRYPDANHFHPSTQGFAEAWPWLLEQLGDERH